MLVDCFSHAHLQCCVLGLPISPQNVQSKCHFSSALLPAHYNSESHPYCPCPLSASLRTLPLLPTSSQCITQNLTHTAHVQSVHYSESHPYFPRPVSALLRISPLLPTSKSVHYSESHPYCPRPVSALLRISPLLPMSSQCIISAFVQSQYHISSHVQSDSCPVKIPQVLPIYNQCIPLLDHV